MAQVNAGRVRFVSRGSYDNSTQYYTFDFVSYNGNCYYAKESTIGNLPTDTNKWQLVATKGSQGDVGPTGNGISTITKTSTSGLVDTYTILYTNGNTTTFDITNGANGNITDVKVDGTSVVDNGEANLLTTGYSTDNKLITEKDYQRAMSIYNVLPKVNGTGENISLDNTGVAPLNIELKGNTSQTQYSGKNLINITDVASTTTNGITYYRENQTYYLSGTNTKTDSVWVLPNNITSGFPELEIGQQYTFKITGNLPSNIYIQLNYRDSNNTNHSLFSQIEDTNSHTITIPNDYAELTQLFVGIRANATNVTGNFVVQLEIGSTATSYEPYVGGTASPNPEFPQRVEVVSGDNSINVHSKNYFNIQDLVKGRLDNGIIGYESDTTSLTTTDTSFTFTTNTNYRGVCTKNYIVLQPATTYVFQSSISSGITIALDCYDENKTYLSRPTAVLQQDGSRTFTTPLNTAFGRIGILLNTGGTITFENPQFELGNTATTYQAFGTTYPINLGTLELCKIGTYQDKFFKAINGNTIYDNLDSTIKNTLDYGKWYLEKNIGKVVLDGSETGWTKNPSITTTNGYSNNALFPYRVSNGGIYCNYLKQVLSLSGNKTGIYNATNCNFLLEGTDYDTETKFKNWLSTYTPIVYYQMSTPTTTEITNTTLINQLNYIEYAMSYQTQTNISQINNGLPMIITAETLRDISEWTNS